MGYGLAMTKQNRVRHIEEEVAYLFRLNGLNSEVKLPSRRQLMEWGRATKSSRCDQRSSEAGLELACHRRSSCHDLSSVDSSTSGAAQRVVTHTG